MPAEHATLDAPVPRQARPSPLASPRKSIISASSPDRTAALAPGKRSVLHHHPGLRRIPDLVVRRTIPDPFPTRTPLDPEPDHAAFDPASGRSVPSPAILSPAIPSPAVPGPAVSSHAVSSHAVANHTAVAPSPRHATPDRRRTAASSPHQRTARAATILALAATVAGCAVSHGTADRRAGLRAMIGQSGEALTARYGQPDTTATDQDQTFMTWSDLDISYVRPGAGYAYDHTTMNGASTRQPAAARFTCRTVFVLVRDRVTAYDQSGNGCS